MHSSLIGIILAAGTGSRLRSLTAERPKALVPVLGKTLFEYTYNFLRGVGCEQIAVVGGFGFLQLVQAGQSLDSSLLFIENPDFRLQNALSYRLALAQAPAGDLLVTDVDFIRPRSLEEKFRARPERVTLFVSRSQDLDQDLMRVQLGDDYRIIDLAKGLPTQDAISAGANYVPHEQRAKLIECVDRAVAELGAEKARLESALRLLAAESGLYAHDVGAPDWFEVDTVEERATAESGVEKRKEDFE